MPLGNVEFPKLNDIFVGETAVNGNWVVANVESAVGWPLKVTKLIFRNRALYILPQTKDPERGLSTYPAVAVALAEGERYEDGQVLIFHFLSSLSWVERQGISVAHWSGGNLPRPMGGGSRHSVISEQFYLPYLPDTVERRPRWALAFYREGLALNHPAYQCLSFFKVLNIFLRGDRAQKEWINANVGQVSDHRAKARLSLLQAQEPDVGHYLYGSNRCAVAHAGSEPTADPENPQDNKRLQDDLPLVQALAEIAIEKVFGIKSATTVYREHLYELAGFHELFGVERVAAIKGNRPVGQEDWPALPQLSIRLALHPERAPLLNMRATVTGIENGIATVRCDSADGLTSMLLYLNFSAERLQIDPKQGITSRDDGSEAAMRQAAAVTRFVSDYVGNGILEVWDAAANRLLGRCDAFLPNYNEFAGAVEYYQDLSARLDAEAEKRSLGPDVRPA